jgi:lipoprotein NlpD
VGLIALAIAGAALVACASGGRAPVVNRSVDTEARADAAGGRGTAAPDSAPPTYRIVAGDTLYSIAWRYGLDYRQVASWNGVQPPYVIYAGRMLKLRPSPVAPTPVPVPAVAARPSPGDTRASTGSGAPTRPTADKPRIDPPEAAIVSDGRPVRWQWPAQGKVTTAESVLGGRGINISGTRGDPVVAAAGGDIVYSGSGLAGYGKLIIIKHNDTFLSAYAHNDELLVQEGAKVASGQKIATMGNTGSRQVMLHFEIRRDGKPVPPLQYLPKKS